jgi:arylsulfatase A-like enzyme
MIMDALRRKGVYDDTAVFFFADHGDFTGDYGVVQKADNVFPDCLTRVPFVIKPPACLPVRPRVSDALVELVDFPATVEAMTGIAPGHTHFGKSLIPVLSGQTDEHRDAVFCEGGRRYGEEACKGLELIPEPVEDNIYWSILKPIRTESAAMGKALMQFNQRLKQACSPG